MSRKSLIILGMIIGSIIGGYVPVLFGSSLLSYSSLIGIWITYKFT